MYPENCTSRFIFDTFSVHTCTYPDTMISKKKKIWFGEIPIWAEENHEIYL